MPVLFNVPSMPVLLDEVLLMLSCPGLVQSPEMSPRVQLMGAVVSSIGRAMVTLPAMFICDPAARMVCPAPLWTPPVQE